MAGFEDVFGYPDPRTSAVTALGRMASPNEQLRELIGNSRSAADAFLATDTAARMAKSSNEHSLAELGRCLPHGIIREIERASKLSTLADTGLLVKQNALPDNSYFTEQNLRVTELISQHQQDQEERALESLMQVAHLHQARHNQQQADAKRLNEVLDRVEDLADRLEAKIAGLGTEE